MFCQSCGSKIDDGVKFCMKCGAAVNSASAQMPPIMAMPQTVPVQQSPAGKRNTLLLISAIIGSVLIGIFIITNMVSCASPNVINVGSPAPGLISMVPCLASQDVINEDSPAQGGAMSFLPLIVIIIATVLTFSAWAKNKKSYALIGGILYIITIAGIVSAILNFVAYSQLKKQEKE